ncbi:MAG TPA: hypothetical protein VD931_15270 [Baekduia sp.]|nr:hypothetical protein [Baekduia sp.]
MPRALLLVVLVALAQLAAPGCGGGDDPARPPAPGRPELPFPPRAAEPAGAPAADARPAGRVVRVGDGPEGVAVDPRTGTVAVGLRDGRLALVDVRTGRARRFVRLPSAPRHVQLARPGGPFLVACEDADALAEVAVTGGVRVTRVGDGPHDAAALADGRIVVADEFGATATIVREGRVVARRQVDVQPGGVAALGDIAAIVSVRAYTVALLGARGRQGDSQNAGYGPSHAVADDDGRVYVTDTRGGGLSVFATRPRLRFVGRTALAGSPYGIAIDRRRGRLWVTLTARNALVELTIGDVPRRLATRATVRQPNTVAVDERSGRLVVASRTDGTLQLLAPSG